MMEQQQMKLNFSLDKTTSVTCDSCGNNSFQEAFLIRKASKFLTGTSQDAIIPVPTFVCTKCGHANNEFLPVEIKTEKQD